jgi:hypothetical protein
MSEKDSKAWKATSSSSSEDLAVKREKSGLDGIGSQDVSPVPGALPAPADADETLEAVIERLPTQFRTEILRQYDMPKTKYGYFTIFRWATPLEVAMQIFGLLMAIGAGMSSLLTLFVRHASFYATAPVGGGMLWWRWSELVVLMIFLYRGCVAAFDDCHGENDEYVWRVCVA